MSKLFHANCQICKFYRVPYFEILFCWIGPHFARVEAWQGFGPSLWIGRDKRRESKSGAARQRFYPKLKNCVPMEHQRERMILFYNNICSPRKRDSLLAPIDGAFTPHLSASVSASGHFSSRLFCLEKSIKHFK